MNVYEYVIQFETNCLYAHEDKVSDWLVSEFCNKLFVVLKLMYFVSYIEIVIKIENTFPTQKESALL